ncbi:hypothetical protein [Psychromonas sp. Urea-02u-13]|uniref:hypothetical protein n=1 Tax=Psychromonas sp. Urea-02u-13 TaxID=2058326 RepID=UPI000C324FDB|nr:hypothetical protein [Psychromonas sp. Urea-02u-13]PKG38759.1 hypothetical protein CXF74_11715 [Psychromonas sp. Urea-02u-13]
MRLLALFLLIISINLYANTDNKSEDKLELTTTFIKGNKELPQMLYIVPWKNIKKTKKTPKDIVLHSLYGDIFQPIIKHNIEEQR